MTKYFPFFHRLTESYLVSSKLDQIRKSHNAIGGRVGFKVQEGRDILDRYVFRIKGKTVGADFKEGTFLGLRELDAGYTRLTEGSIASLLGKAKSKVIPRTSNIAKDILRGSEVFADAERKIRLFLRRPKGKNIFVLYGSAGIGKTASARAALNTECGAALSSSKSYKTLVKRSFDKPDFEIRLRAFESIEKAKNLYKRFLHNFTLSAGHNRSGQQDLFGMDLKQKALAATQEKLQHDLTGYDLTLDDMEKEGDIHKSASDIIDKLKKLGGIEASIPYNPKHGWMEISQKENDEELFLHMYVSNGGVMFVDEGDYFLENPNPLVKVAFNNEPYRKVSIGSKGYAEVQNRVIPDEIVYSGKLVITTNLPASKWDSAIKSRADTYAFYLTLSQLFDRLKDIIPAIHAKDLPHIPARLVVGMSNTLKKLAAKGELTTFDYRNFISLCDELALIIEDEILREKQTNPNITFSIYGNGKKPVSDVEFTEWLNSPDGKSIYARASNKFKKTLLNQIQQMNRARPLEDPNNVIEFQKDGAMD
jgi:hypothetical protein